MSTVASKDRLRLKTLETIHVYDVYIMCISSLKVENDDFIREIHMELIAGNISVDFTYEKLRRVIFFFPISHILHAHTVIISRFVS